MRETAQEYIDRVFTERGRNDRNSATLAITQFNFFN